MRNRGNVLDQFDIQAGSLKSSDRAFSSGTRTFDTDFHITHAELAGLFGCLLGGTLTGKGSALSASLESAGSGTGPTKRVAFGVRDRHRRVVERRVNVGNAIADVTPNSFFLVGLCHGKVLCAM